MELERIGGQEKRRIAFISVMAALVLTVGKLIVGYLTNSLGIYSEVAHSGLDLVAAMMTFFAVRVSGRPADQEHTYGHGKVENLSALFETLLLLATCFWIVWAAFDRLFFTAAETQANVWSFIVMAVSIIINILQSRALLRVAKKHQSQALEADALHFSTDVWSSLVVIVGLGFVYLSDALQIPWLIKADALAALGVAVIVVWISVKLGKKTIADLLDAVPPGLRDDVFRLAKVPGVVEVARVRVRRSGPEKFVDVTLRVKRESPFEITHEIATQAELSIRKILPEADVVVHVEPMGGSDENALATIRVLAARLELGAHGITISEQSGARSVDMHLEVNEGLRVDEAHKKSNAFEKELRQALPDLERITTHLEPIGTVSLIQKALPIDDSQILKILRELPKEMNPICHPHSIKALRIEDEITISMHCAVDATMAIGDAHRQTIKIEQLLRERLPQLGRVVIHVEPSNETTHS
ncbi:MAG: cation-efflux pump [Planctomycetota bacterium]